MLSMQHLLMMSLHIEFVLGCWQVSGEDGLDKCDRQIHTLLLPLSMDPREDPHTERREEEPVVTAAQSAEIQ